MVQYQSFLGGLARGDLGTSFRYNTPVTKEILTRLGPTTALAVVAMVVAILIAIPLGVIGALYRGRAIDRAAMAVSLAGIAMPNFWLGPVLAIIFSVELGWLPVSGSGTWRHLVLPSLTLGSALAAVTRADDPRQPGR
jgi:peptide/nickel transport system permease protein